MSLRPCYHKGQGSDCTSGDACPWALAYWRRRALLAEERIRRSMRRHA